MASVISDFICGTRNFLAQGFRSLPVILGSAVLLLGLTQANFNLLFFFVGMFILAPTATFIVNAMWELYNSNMPSPYFRVPAELWAIPDGAAKACQIFTIGPGQPSGTPVNVVPSFWLTMMAFFFSYLFVNAWSLYNLQASSRAPAEAVKARKSQMVMSMIIILIIAVLTFIFRYSTGCETSMGLLVSTALGSALATSWYQFMKACGLGRLDDLFSISARILPMQSYEDASPTVCVPTQAATA